MGLYHDLVPSSKDNIQWPCISTDIRVIAMFHMLPVGLNYACPDWSIVLDITWNYTMAWYPAHKILWNKLLDVIK